MATKTKRGSRRSSGLRVMVTGGTGFVGFHTVRVLHEAGHDVVLLVRSPEKMQRVMRPFGLDGLAHVQGDIADRGSVHKALKGCDAVVHAAAMVNIHAKDAVDTIQTNRRGTELVIGGAVETGIERIVQVSSSTALFNPGLEQVDEKSPLGTQAVGYGRSKIESDLYVRGLQAKGASVYTTYPGTILGPDDPGLSEGMVGLGATLDTGVFLTSSGIQIIDVRDLAEVHRRLLERGGPPARYPMGGTYFAWSDFADLLDEVIGQPLRRIKAPGRALQAAGRLGDLINRFISFEFPLSYEATWYATEWTPSDDSLVKKTLGFEYRDPRETLADSILWLSEAGHLKRTEFADYIRRRRQRQHAATAGKRRARARSRN